MSAEVLRALANHLWQSTLFAAVAGLVTLLLRKNRARVRHGVWLAAFCKFLIPLFMLVALGNHLAPQTATPAAQSRVFVEANEVSAPFARAATEAREISTAPRLPDRVPRMLFGAWACGFIWIACSWILQRRRIRAMVRAGAPVDMGLPIRVISSSAFPEPGVFGILRPTLLLPEGIAGHLSPAQLEAVIAHELCHVRHGDNLAAAFQMLLETVFWFHPLVWWMGKRMVAERERACDEEVLRQGGEPRVYAESILRVCALQVGVPLRCVSGATGANLKKRIEAIVTGRRGAELSSMRKAALAVLGTVCFTLPVLIGIFDAPPVMGESETSVPLSPPPGMKFRAVSIERCRTYIPGEIESPTPGRLIANCVTTASLIHMAYLKSATGDSNGAPLFLSWEPGWTGSGNYLYRIEAQGDRSASLATMEGPMLQWLLADRFGLKARRVTRESPMYSLTVAKNGARLKRSRERSCTGAWRRDARFAQPFRQNCIAFAGPEEQYEALQGDSIDLGEFCHLLSGVVGRPVVDKTGIAGRFDFHLQFANGETPAALGQLYPALPEVLDGQLGLKLDSIRGPAMFLVIDRVEKPLPE